MMDVTFGSPVALCTTEFEYILEDALEEGLKKSALKPTLESNNNNNNNNNATSHPIEKATTNVVCIRFADVDTNQHMSTGDPLACIFCKGILNYKSVVVNETSWSCEFCGHQNQLQAPVDANEIPTTHVTEYLLEPPSTKKDEVAVIFCLDISGSMDGERIRALRLSLDEQLMQLAHTKPECRVGLIIFSSEVSFVTGVEGSNELLAPTGALHNFTEMVGFSHACKAVGKIQDTVSTLRSYVQGLTTKGSTALGPALLLSICVAGALGAGSQVVTCTDGQANVGMGAHSSERWTSKGAIEQEGPDFYTSLANSAKERGVSVSVMSFKDTDVSLEKLAVLADKTGGSVKMTDLSRLSKSFGNVVADSVVAWRVEVTRVTSRNVKIEPADVKAEIGNCIKNSEVTSEFTVASDPAHKEILFQTQVRYTRVTDGARMLKVFTHVLPVVNSRATAEESANLALLALHAVRLCAKRAQEGVYTHARLSVYAHQRLLARVAQVQGKSEDYLRFLEDLEIIDGELRYTERQEEKSGLRERGDRDRDRDRDRRDDRRDRRDDRGANVFYQMKAWNARNMRRSRSRSPPARDRRRSRSRSPRRNTTATTTTSTSARSTSPARDTSMRSRSPPMRDRRRSPSPRRDRRDRDFDRDRRDRDRDSDRDRDRRDRDRDRDSDRDRRDYGKEKEKDRRSDRR